MTFYFGILATAASITFVLFADFLPTLAGSYADQRFLLVAITGIVSIGALYLIVTRSQKFRHSLSLMLPTSVLALSFPVLALPYAQQSYVFVEPGMYAFYFFAMISGAAALVFSGSGDRYARVVTVLASAACFLYGAMSVTVYLFAVQDRFFNLDNLIPWGFVNIRYWSHVATWLMPILPLAILVGPFGKFRLWRVIVATGAGLWWWIILLSTSRGTILGLLFGTLLVVLLFGRYSLPWLKLFLFYLVIGVLVWLLLSVLIPSLLAGQVELRSVSTDSAGRMPLFVEAWSMSLKELPFGMGPQSWLTHDLLTEGYAQSKKFGHPHNMYLMWAAEYGWVLLAVLAGLVVQVIRSFWRRRGELILHGNTDGTIILAGFTASVSAALFHAGVSAVFIAPGSMLVGLVVLTGFCALIETGKSVPQVRTTDVSGLPARRFFARFSALVLAFLWAVWLGQVAGYYTDMRQDEAHYQEEVGGATLPRFWFHGNFPRAAAPSDISD